MIAISEAKVGLPVAVEDNYFIMPGVITVIDPERGQVGVRKVFSGDTGIFPVEKVYFRYPCPNNGHQLGLPAPTPAAKEKNLARLFGGYIITLSRGESTPAALNEVAEIIRKTGISRESVRAQEIIETLR